MLHNHADRNHHTCTRTDFYTHTPIQTSKHSFFKRTLSTYISHTYSNRFVYASKCIHIYLHTYIHVNTHMYAQTDFYIIL